MHTEPRTQKPSFLAPGYERPKTYAVIAYLIRKNHMKYFKSLIIVQMWATSIQLFAYIQC